jgi:hypothetical protein
LSLQVVKILLSVILGRPAAPLDQGLSNRADPTVAHESLEHTNWYKAILGENK